MRIKSKRTSTYIESYTLSFEYIGTEQEGYSNRRGCGFDCDKDGVVDVEALHPCALETYLEAKFGQVVLREGEKWGVRKDADGYSEYYPLPGTGTLVTREVTKGEIRTYGKHHKTPAVGECDRCGRDVHLHGFTNTCECGEDYNMSGQRLACRSQWGEDTGESITDILLADICSDLGVY